MAALLHLHRIVAAMHPHPNYEDFLAALQRTPSATTSFRGPLYRACDPIYANTRDLLTGEGSRSQGGRWNAPKSFATVYLAQSVEGSIAETLGLPGYYGLAPSKRLPLTLVEIEAVLDTVVDFTDPKLRRSLKVPLRAMNECDWRSENAAGREAMTQALSRAAFKLGVQGIIVPSAVKRAYRNLDVFPANLGSTSRLKIKDSEKLPPPPAPGVL